MGKLDMFVIEMWENISVFYGGSNVAGRVVVVLNDGMKMRNLRIELKGEANVRWTEQERRHNNHNNNNNNHSQTHSVTYSNSETYVNYSSILWGPQGGEDSGVMPPGRYELPFQFQLPPNIPTSFEGQNGSIRYQLKATIDKPWKFDHTVKRVFTVLGVQDLNLDPNARMPAEGSRVKTLGCGCCSSGTISATIRCPKRGYVGGETLQIFADINNASTKRIKRTEVELLQVTRFHGQKRGGFGGYGPHTKTRHNSKTVVQVKRDTEIGPHSTEQWTGQGADAFIIPPLPPMLFGCNIIDIYYELSFKLVPSGAHMSSAIKIPITIGTVPLRDIIPAFQQNYSSFQNGGYPASTPMPSAPAMPSQVSQEYPDLPPPSYQDSVFGPTNVRDENDTDYTQGQMDFAPQYAYYNWQK